MNESIITRGHWHLISHSAKQFYHFQFGREYGLWKFFCGNFFFESIISICSPLIPGPFSVPHESHWIMWFSLTFTPHSVGGGHRRQLGEHWRSCYSHSVETLCSIQVKWKTRWGQCLAKEATNPLRSKSRTCFHSVRVPPKATLWHELHLNIKDMMAETWKMCSCSKGLNSFANLCLPFHWLMTTT